MLPHLCPTEETAMDEQLSLFETASKRWVERLWERAGLERREAALEVLAQMAAAHLTRTPAPPEQEAHDES